MEKRIEKWESLRLEAQQFVPQEFVAQCELIIDHQYEVNKNGIVPGVHPKYDDGDDRIYTINDHNRRTITSDGNPADIMYYVGMGWGKPQQGGQITWPNESELPLNYDQMIERGYQLFILMSKTKGDPNETGAHVYSGNSIETLIKNQS